MMLRLVAVALVVGCGSSGSKQGELGQACYPNGTCNVGLSCFAGTCVAADAPMFDAAIPDAFEPAVCADDSTLEPNDSIQTAYVTPVDAQSQSLQLTSLAICPITDKDHYAITLSSGSKAIETIASWAGGSPITLSLLNAGGTSIVNGSAMGTNALRACAPNLPAGTYYALVGAGAAKNNYSLSIKVLASCAN